MTKKNWLKHAKEVTGKTPPSEGGLVTEWQGALRDHLKDNPDCPECKARRKTRAKNQYRSPRDIASAAVGLKKVRVDGRTMWEDVYKYGKKDEIEFLLEVLMPGSFVKSMMNFKNYLDSPQGRDAKVQYQNLLSQVNEVQKKGSMEIVKFLRDNQKPVGDFINFVDLLLKGKRPPEPALINLP